MVAAIDRVRYDEELVSVGVQPWLAPLAAAKMSIPTLHFPFKRDLYIGKKRQRL